jgi:hypothetical protein
MMELDLEYLAAAVTARATGWQEAGVQWQLHHGPNRDKSSAWVDCITTDRLAQLIVWTSGEAELNIGDISTGAIAITNYQMSNIAELAAGLDGITSHLTPPNYRYVFSSESRAVLAWCVFDPRMSLSTAGV